MPDTHPQSIDAVQEMLQGADYVADRSLATVLFLALKMRRPLFLEGEAGVGKTEIAKVLAEQLGSAVYEWDYARQMIEIRLAEATETADKDRLSSDIFSEKFLIKRPLLKALESNVGGAPVLLIDELDRTDEPFEAFLLEVLSDFQVTIPEFGTIRAKEPPIVIITSNRTREIHDALKRRCLYHWVDYPDAEREKEIIARKLPDIDKRLSEQIVLFIQALRQDPNLFKLPGVAETLDWSSALKELDIISLDPDVINDTLGVLLKYQDDIVKIQGSEAAEIIRKINTELGTK